MGSQERKTTKNIICFKNGKKFWFQGNNSLIHSCRLCLVPKKEKKIAIKGNEQHYVTLVWYVDHIESKRR